MASMSECVLNANAATCPGNECVSILGTEILYLLINPYPPLRCNIEVPAFGWASVWEEGNVGRGHFGHVIC